MVPNAVSIELGITSRRSLLATVAAAPFAAITNTSVGLVPVAFAQDEAPAMLRRSREGRHLSRLRYHRAESFFTPVEQGLSLGRSDQFYQVGIVLQLALSSHLLDVGFADAWCAQNIGLYVNKSLERANATGLGHDCPDLKALAKILSPYGRWRNADVRTTAGVCPFSREQICRLTRDLLERVRDVTGHPRRRRQGARNS